MFGKRRYVAVMLLLLGLLLVCNPEVLHAEKPLIPRQVEKLTMTPGSIYYLDIRNVGNDDIIKIVSDTPEVVTVNAKGKLGAKKCGVARVLVTMSHDAKVRQIELKVTVKYDRYFTQKSYGNDLKKTSSRSAAYLYLHKQLAKGQTSQLLMHGLEKDACVTYRSTKPDVAVVDKNGLVTAKSSGKTVITCTVAQNERTYDFFEVIHVSDAQTNTAKISEKERNAWFADAGFIGNSIGVGQRMYFDSKGKGYLGNPVMMVRGCYSFANDDSRSNKYKITYQGQPYKARTAVKLSGVKRLFINMGTNDLWTTPENVYKRYVSYLDDIRKDSPNVVIFIESTTPVASGHEGAKLSNRNVNRLNQLMKDYCASEPDMYYIDVNSCLKGSDGCLKPSYTSDRYVHLTMSAYAQWMNVLCAYTDRLMIAENRAEDAVKTAEQSLRREDYERARKLVKKLDESTVQTGFLKRLKNIKGSLKKDDTGSTK